MIAISKQEKTIIAERCSNIHIVRTMKHDSKRHHYYMAEHSAAMRIIHELRNDGKAGKRNKFTEPVPVQG